LELSELKAGRLETVTRLVLEDVALESAELDPGKLKAGTLEIDAVDGRELGPVELETEPLEAFEAA